MEDVRLQEKRDCVRAALSVEVQFSVMDAHEYEAIRDEGNVRSRRFVVKPIRQSVPGEEEDYRAGRAVDSSLIDFLIQIEDKLDRVLRLLAKYEKSDEGLFVGKGLDIGGGGMRILCDQAVKSGQILDTSFRIFRYPVVSLQIFGKVTRVSPIQENDNLRYEVALEFLDLDEDYKEWIISYVFQTQREAIRSKKKK
jgi:hypothetical protein